MARFRADPAVTPPAKEGRGFGASALKVDGKIFAMLSDGELVVKVSRDRVAELVEDGKAKPFDPGHGRIMKEWVSVSPRRRAMWSSLADEAREYVAGAAARARRR